MGRLIWAGVFTVIIAVSCVLSGQSVYKNTAKMISEIENVQSLVENERYDEAAEKVKKCEDKWVDYESRLAPYVNHEDLQAIGVSIASIEPLVRGEDRTLALSYIKTTKTLLIHQQDVNLFAWRDFV